MQGLYLAVHDGQGETKAWRGKWGLGTGDRKQMWCGCPIPSSGGQAISQHAVMKPPLIPDLVLAASGGDRSRG